MLNARIIEDRDDDQFERMDLRNVNLPPVRSQIDNAITAAFRVVVGWCPFRDRVPNDRPTYLKDERGQYQPDVIPTPRPRPPHATPDPFQRMRDPYRPFGGYPRDYVLPKQRGQSNTGPRTSEPKRKELS